MHLKPTSVVATALIALVAGCVSSERKPAVQAVTSLSDTRTELVAGRANIDEAIAALGTLEAQPDNLTPPYNQYKTSVTRVERRAKAVTERVRDMRERSAEYRTSWAEENAQISDPTIRATSQERRERVMERYQQVDQKVQALRPAYDPFIRQLRDLETVLANDLTYAGVQAARPAFERIRQSANTLRDQIDAVVAELDDASMRLSPSTQPAR
jgi:chromosome segregation ATPase